jgi:single-strand DNA-binding protein
MSLNKVCLIGRLGKDPEIRSMNNGNEVASFTLATSDTWKDKQTGEKKEKTEWHRIVVFSSGLINVVKNYVKKGTQIYLEGSLQTRKWQDKDGKDVYTTEIILQGFNSVIQLLGSANSSSAGGSYSAANSEVPFPEERVSASDFIEDKIDDIPF